MMRTIRLSELVQQGRLAMVAEIPNEQLESPMQQEAAASPKVTHSPTVAKAPSRPRVSADVVDKIELLAIQLLAISKTSKADPEAVMREALISIDQCIVSLAPRH